ncbi:ABC transporter substrate-binding protein [Deinococcus arenicola]|uniref:ABC transporter substrate-binding protein n=1 Tax=Deinococcus arenicola TaxID=2994950 RepID=A0ABU4DPJ0_9DEIO|nr:ABC transporter substrate-binding protein [Deinococcus sp. ZS9-10]MDV6374348.1 ABC transporter substrate-binding protein [Deinococcus sp. ZS9-10]
MTTAKPATKKIPAKKILSAIALTTLTLSLAACKSDTASSTTTTTDTATTADTTTADTSTPSGAEPTGVLVIQQSSDVPTLDPGTTYDTGSGQVVENLYETLLTYQGNSLSELKPLLATEWTEEEGGLGYRFTLRDGVKFHTGNPFECKDAEYTFRRNLVTNTSDSGNWFLGESLLGTGSNANDDTGITWQRITDAVACDGQTLVFKLPKADPAFLAKLAYIGQGIVDSKHAQDIGEWDGTEATWKAAVGKDLTGSALSADPSGTGAYKLLDKTATAITATAFTDYWGDGAKIKNVILQKIPEQAARLQAFEKGDADIVETGGRAIIDAQLKGKPGIAVLDDLPNPSAFGISMNQKISGDGAIGSGKLDGAGIPANFFSDVDVRRGFVAAFNTPQYIADVQKGKGAPLNFLLPTSFPGYDASIEAPKYDIEAANEYFKTAWDGQVWEKGFTVNVSYRAGSAAAQTGMEILKKNIESINPKFRVNIIAKEWSDIIKGSNQGTEAMVNTGWAPDYADPDNFVYTFYSSKGYYNPRINAKDEQIDTWIDEARSITDTDKRNTLYADIAKRAIEQAWYIYLPNQPGVLAYRDNLQGVGLDTYNPMLGFANQGTGTLWKNLSKS